MGLKKRRSMSISRFIFLCLIVCLARTFCRKVVGQRVTESRDIRCHKGTLSNSSIPLPGKRTGRRSYRFVQQNAVPTRRRRAPGGAFVTRLKSKNDVNGFAGELQEGTAQDLRFPSRSAESKRVHPGKDRPDHDPASHEEGAKAHPLQPLRNSVQ